MLAAVLILIASTARASPPSASPAPSDFGAMLGKRKGCLIVEELVSGKPVQELGAERCAQRSSPNSTFKIAAAVMAFEDGVFKDETQKIPWDGVKHERAELNRDQTPASWMRDSVVWVTQIVTARLGMTRVRQWLGKLDYGNRDFSGGLDRAWLDSSLRISPREQIAFLRRLRLGQLPVSARARDLAWKVMEIPGKPFELHGKTGTGCLDAVCDGRRGRMRGWFVGVFKRGDKEYVFAAHADDTEPQPGYAGPKLRDTVIEYLNRSYGAL